MSYEFIGLILVSGLVGMLLMTWVLGTVFPVFLYLRARKAGVPVEFADIVGMSLRGTRPGKILTAASTAFEHGVHLSIAQLEAHSLAGGDVNSVVLALCAARRGSLELDFRMAAAINLAGHNPFEAVKQCLEPRQLTTPPISALARNGRKVSVSANVTVRCDICSLVGGASQEVLLARIIDHVVTAIRESEDHQFTAQRLDSLAKDVLQAGLDHKTAWQLLAVVLQPA